MNKRSDRSTERWIKIMCDYTAEGVWMRGGAVRLDELAISAGLKARLRGWQAYYEMNGAPETAVFFDVEVFSREGLSIAKAVKAELPGWTVVYFDEALASASLEGSRTGSSVYEIILPKDSEPPI